MYSSGKHLKDKIGRLRIASIDCRRAPVISVRRTTRRHCQEMGRKCTRTGRAVVLATQDTFWIPRLKHNRKAFYPSDGGTRLSHTFRTQRILLGNPRCSSTQISWVQQSGIRTMSITSAGQRTGRNNGWQKFTNYWQRTRRCNFNCYDSRERIFSAVQIHRRMIGKGKTRIPMQKLTGRQIAPPEIRFALHT